MYTVFKTKHSKCTVLKNTHESSIFIPGLSSQVNRVGVSSMRDFHQLSPLGRVGLEVAMSVYMSSPSIFFFRGLSLALR